MGVVCSREAGPWFSHFPMRKPFRKQRSWPVSISKVMWNALFFANPTAVFNILILITWKAIERRKKKRGRLCAKPMSLLCLSLRNVLRIGWLPKFCSLQGQGCSPCSSLNSYHTHSLPRRSVLSTPITSCEVAHDHHTSLFPCILQK